MIAKQTQGPALATYGQVKLNPLAAKVGVDKGPNGTATASPCMICI